MRNLTFILSFCVAGHAYAQTLVPEPDPDASPGSILEKNLDDPFSFNIPVLSKSDPEIEDIHEPVIQQDDDPEEVPEVAKDELESPGERPEIQTTPDEGISIQVEKPSVANGAAVPNGDVKIYSPWPAKPIFPAPEGWKFAPAPEGMMPYQTEAKLSTGQKVSLSITPFVLVPITDGQNSIRITEPGYNPQLGYAQHETVGVMLQKSNADLEQNEKEVAGSISRLQQLLSSLPKPTAGGPSAPTAPAEPQP